ncbi:MAG: hypothetical protein ACLQU5_00280 [Isosphaeraceae bacterium]
MSMTWEIPRLSSRFQISTPESPMAFSSRISIAAICDRQGEPSGRRGPSSQPPSAWSIG